MNKFLKIFLGIFAIILLGAGGFAGYLYFQKAETRDAFSFVSPDFMYLLESDEPIRDWRSLSKSDVWRHLKKNDYLADLTGSADLLDSLINDNASVAQMVKLGELLVTAHPIPGNSYDFVFIVDLKKGGSKVAAFKGSLNTLLESFGYKVSTEKYFNFTIFKLYDPVYKDTLCLALIDNILVGSYTLDLLKQSIIQTESETVLNKEDFVKVRQKADLGTSYSIYLNYSRLPALLDIYMDGPMAIAEGLDKDLLFSNFDLTVADKQVEFSGYTLQNDSSASIFRVFQDVGKGSIHAQDILPQHTAMFLSFGFEDFSDFVDKLEAFYKKQSPAEYRDLQKKRDLVEDFLDIDIKRDFFSWMDEEIVLAVIPTDSAMTRYSYYVMFHFKDFKEAKERLDFVGKKIKRRSPLKFKELEYKGFELRYLDPKGFFGLFFKKLFKKIDQPHYTYLDDYVVFSNSEENLHYLIDDYLEGKPLARDKDYRRFAGKFDRKSNIFTYIHNEYAYNFLLADLEGESRASLEKNKAYLMSFPRAGFQLSPSDGMFKTFVFAEFDAQ
jgi:hypothetical protein